LLTHAYTTAGWESLFVAEAGASATLAGLLFVAVSINLARVLEHPGLPGWAMGAAHRDPAVTAAPNRQIRRLVVSVS
jgi:hypothetical protein